MIFKKEIRKPILALIFISLGGWMLHFRAHPITADSDNLLPFFLGLVNVIITPILFNHKKTVLLAYLINGIGVIVGSIAMAAFSLSHLPEPLTFTTLIFKTTLADIFILFSKLFIGQAILSYFYPAGLGRLFTTSWWVRHFCYLSIIFALGHFLWR
ncbi:MAG TPA: hypothetical protein VF369_09245 [candidate division Zixibacteria bacterium]